MAKPELLATKLSREHAAELLLIEAEELKKLRVLYLEARLGLIGRLASFDRESFSAQQTRMVLLQVTQALREMNKKLDESWDATLDKRLQRSVTQTLREIAQFEPKFKQAQGGIQTEAVRKLARPHGLLLDQFDTSVATFGTGLIRTVGNRLAMHSVMKSTWRTMSQDVARTMKVEMWRAERIVRTELIDALDAAHEVALQSAALLLPDLASQWDATNDSRVCVQCAHLNGQVVPLGKLFDGLYPGPPAHPSCRCRRVPYRAVWAEKTGAQAEAATIEAAAVERAAAERAANEKRAAEAKARAERRVSAQSQVRARVAQTRAITKAEAGIRNQDFETAIAFNDDGAEFFRKDGDRASVGFSLEEAKSFRGRRFTHNHPSGGSFSAQDIRLATTHGLAEIRAVGSEFTYSMLPPKRGWTAEMWKSEIEPAWARAHSDTIAELMPHVRAGRMTPAEADFEHWHRVWIKVSKDTGLRYSRKKR